MSRYVIVVVARRFTLEWYVEALSNSVPCRVDLVGREPNWVWWELGKKDLAMWARRSACATEVGVSWTMTVRCD
eukprot:13807555-Alexandrium_andersonii.AAC.1